MLQALDMWGPNFQSDPIFLGKQTSGTFVSGWFCNMFLRILGCDIIGVVVKYYLVYWKPLYMDVSFTRQYFQDDMSGLEHESMIT